MTKLHWLAGTSLLVAGLCLGAAPNAAAQSVAKDSTSLEEVVVTAQRREERLLDVPIAVSTVNAQELKGAGAVTTRDLGQLVTGMTSTTNGLSFQPAIRGITTTGTSAGDESNVALYVDGVYMASSAGNVFNLKNIERIEVLKGPQGTLFGRNATGGAILVITSDPAFKPEAHLTGSYGTQYKGRELNAYVATGLTDTVAVSLAANSYDDDGYTKSINPQWTGGNLATTSSWYVRSKVLWKPSDSFKAILSGDIGRYRSDTQFALAPLDGLNINKNNPAVVLPTGPFQYSGNVQGNERVKMGGASLLLQYQGSNYNVKSTSAYRKTDMAGLLDTDRTNLPNSVSTASLTFKTLSEEVVYASEYSGPVNFVAGAFLFSADSGIPDQRAFAAPTPIVVNGVITSLGRVTQSLQGFVDTRSWAVFGEGTWDVTDKFSVIGGVRYTSERKELLTRILDPTTSAVTGEITDKEDWSNVNYRLTGKYAFNKNTNVYATYSTGFKSGQYSAVSPAFIQKVDPETVKAFEVGFKSRLTDSLELTTSAFHYKFSNIQLQFNNFQNGAFFSVLANAAEATTAGADADLTARLTDKLRVQVGLAWLPTARYDRYPGGLDSVPKGYPGSLDPSLCTSAPPSPNCGAGNDQIIRDLSGTRMIRSPEFTAKLGAMYETTVRDGALRTQVNYFHSSGFFWVPGEHIKQPDYGLLNATISWTDPSGHYTATLWGRNLTDKAYGLYTSPNSQGVNTAWAAPREIGVSLDLDF